MSAMDLEEVLATSGDYAERENAILQLCGLPEVERETDLGNARRFVRLHGERLRYAHDLSRWFIWDGTRWKADTDGQVVRLATDVPRDIYRQAGDAKHEGQRKSLARHGADTESERRLKSLVSIARSLPGIPASPGDFDADPWSLNTRNCVVHLRTGDTARHAPNWMCSKIAGADFDFDASAPTWFRCLERWLPDPEVRDFVHRAVGYSLIGETLEEVLFILWGSGANGKTKFVEALRAALGDYAMNTPAETLMASNYGGGVPNDVARLMGARFVSAAESEENRRLNEAKVKAMTGGDVLTARFMRGEWFEFRPVFSVWLSTNHKPIVTGQDLGIWRRIRLIPFNVTIPEAERDPHLSERLMAELPGILAWAVEGCIRYQREGLDAPEAVTVATADYRRESDTFGEFLEDRCVEVSEAFTRTDALFSAYREWSEAAGERALTKTAFGRKLSERGFEQVRVGGHRGRVGLSLRSDTGAGHD